MESNSASNHPIMGKDFNFSQKA